jgi:hypothetical protein
MVTHSFMSNKSLKEIFFWPTVVAALSVHGLLLALLKDGVVEQVSLLGLATPLVLTVYFYWIKKVI